MRFFKSKLAKVATLGVIAASGATYQFALAHCDTVEGPVAKAARASLATGKVDESLWWVQEKDEPEIRKAFSAAIAARKGSAESRSVADEYFLENLVRVHRMGEGESYTGIKPLGTPIDPAIAMADRALTKKDADELANEVAWHVKQAIKARYSETVKLKAHSPHSVAAGREYVAAYVHYIHMIEAIDAAVSAKAGHGGHKDGHAK
jgi:hypothetical protein